MFPGARVLQLCCNEARVCATARHAKQRVYKGNRQLFLAGVFFMVLDCHLPEGEFTEVEWCSDTFISLMLIF